MNINIIDYCVIKNYISARCKFLVEMLGKFSRASQPVPRKARVLRVNASGDLTLNFRGAETTRRSCAI